MASSCQVGCKKTFVNDEIESLRIFYPPLVRKRIARKTQRHAIPFQDKTDRLFKVIRGDTFNHHAVLFK
jgi:hypothetical protein